MGFEVVTFATHSERMFPQLMNSGYSIKVLGWGVKWENFNTKIKGVLEYVKTKNPDDIIVCVDAFDTAILRDPREAEQLFKDMNCGFLVSYDILNSDFMLEHFKLKFGTCKDNITANMGLWMGYVKYIIPILEDILKIPCGDDQINFNSLCSKYRDVIKIDMEKKIFANLEDTNSIFKGFPGTGKRHIKTYINDILPHFIIQYTFIFLCLLILFPKYKLILIAVYTTLLITFIFMSDKKCINIKKFN
jgi:hypothetical protein